MSSFILEPAQELDINIEWTNVLFDAFNAHSPINNGTHLDNLTPAGRERAVKYFKQNFKMHNTRFVKVTKDEELIGVADYEIHDLGGKKFPLEPPIAPADNWDTAEEKEWADSMWISFLKNRNRGISERPALIRLCVKSEYQRQGAGKLVMKYAIDLADALGAEMTVEASANRKLLYQQFGFIDPFPGRLELDVPEKFEDKPKEALFFMHRPARS